MLTVSSCPPDPRVRGVRRLERRLYTYAGLEDFVLLYPLYALLFAEHGLTTAEISSLFAIWCVVGLLVEVPSGVFSDAVSRRVTLVAGPLLTAVGFALWALTPSYAAYAAGFTLWAVGGSLRSGSMEALVHDELERLGAADRYGRIMGRAAAFGMAATAAATAAAAPALAFGGDALVWARRCPSAAPPPTTAPPNGRATSRRCAPDWPRCAAAVPSGGRWSSPW
jgi:MFS family permease